MRGFKKDISATNAAYAAGKLMDAKRRSFISQPKHISGESVSPCSHLILYGPDATSARMKLFQRENNRCQKCKCVVVWGYGEYGMAGELHHIRHKPWNRCWCPENLALICQRCHGVEHSGRAPRFGPEKVLA